jgi:hypothetical protein
MQKTATGHEGENKTQWIHARIFDHENHADKRQDRVSEYRFALSTHALVCAR